jgi:hypothetical protein
LQKIKEENLKVVEKFYEQFRNLEENLLIFAEKK